MGIMESLLTMQRKNKINCAVDKGKETEFITSLQANRGTTDERQKRDASSRTKRWETQGKED